jgi:type IX secretion system PorP/SprF family membrane protein
MKLKINEHQRSIRTIALLTLVLIISAVKVKGQTQQFSYTQYMDNLTPLNPAYSLLDKAGSVNMLGRKEWVGIDGAPTTFLFNGNVPISSIDAAAGLTVMNDQFAIEHQTEVNAYFAKGIQLGQAAYLGVSLNAGIRNYVANYTDVANNGAGPVDPVFATNIRQTKPNVGFGVMYYTDWYYIGVSAPELTITSLGTASIQNSANFTNHYYFSGALITTVAEDIKFKPATLFTYGKGEPTVADFSGTFYFKETLGLGLDYRTNSEMAGIITLNVSGFHIGYSYQFGTNSNNLGGINTATHEVSISYRFGKGAAVPKLL